MTSLSCMLKHKFDASHQNNILYPTKHHTGRDNGLTTALTKIVRSNYHTRIRTSTRFSNLIRRLYFFLFVPRTLRRLLVVPFLVGLPSTNTIMVEGFSTISQPNINPIKRSFLSPSYSFQFSSTSGDDYSASSDYTEEDLHRWEKMYEEGASKSPDRIETKTTALGAPCQVRVVTFDLDNTLWNTTATIDVANNALSTFMNRLLPGNTVRVEHVMGELYQNNKARYAPIEKENSKSPVLLTQLRKDAIQKVIEMHSNGNKENDSNDTDRVKLVDEAFGVWTSARHEAIPSHLAESVVQCLKKLRSLDDPLLIGAITDGNSDPWKIPILSKYFDFCINAEMVGVSKPDERLYLRAVKEAVRHPILQDLQYHSKLSDDALRDCLGPWWVHVGDDFVKDIVAAKQLNMRSIWARELVLDKLLARSNSWDPNEDSEAEEEKKEPTRTVEDLVKDLAEAENVIEMQVGSTDYLAGSLQAEFADATTDQFRTVVDVICGWQTEANHVPTFEEKGSEIVEVLSSVKSGDQTQTKQQNDFKYCITCGEQLPNFARFCSSCGTQQL